MNYSIFFIKEQVDSLLGKHITDDVLIKNILNKKNSCRELIKLQENKKNQYLKVLKIQLWFYSI